MVYLKDEVFSKNSSNHIFAFLARTFFLILEEASDWLAAQLGQPIRNNLHKFKRSLPKISFDEFFENTSPLGMFYGLLTPSSTESKFCIYYTSQCSKIRKKVQLQKCKKALFAFSKMAKNQFLHQRKV